jgi:hypothetical protein
VNLLGNLGFLCWSSVRCDFARLDRDHFLICAPVVSIRPAKGIPGLDRQCMGIIVAKGVLYLSPVIV